MKKYKHKVKRVLLILLNILIFLSMVIFLTGMCSLAHASVKMAPYQTKTQIEMAKFFGFLFFVVGILGRVIVGMKRSRPDETFDRQVVTVETVETAVPVAQIIAKRDSMCMADDVTTQNAEMIDILEKDMLSDMVEKLARHYLPHMPNSVWAVDSGNRIIAYITIGDKKGSFSYELGLKNQVFLETGIKALYCSFFSAYGNSPSIDTVKWRMRNRFLEKLRLNEGSLCIWGELIGQLHLAETVQWFDDRELRIYFTEGFLHIDQPTNVIIEAKQLIVEDAAEVLWVWYDDEKSHTYENMYIRQYIKICKGIIRRAEGRKMQDISGNDGVIFRPLKEQAICLEQKSKSVSHIPEKDY